MQAISQWLTGGKPCHGRARSDVDCRTHLLVPTHTMVTMEVLDDIFAEGELTESATSKGYLQVRQEGARQVERNLRHYNLAVILAMALRTGKSVELVVH
ncbi:MAG: hypothetical protein K9K38_06185 [Rhodoferax sp.]|nr:hypothetical protein [Rhodoferax sp.]